MALPIDTKVVEWTSTPDPTGSVDASDVRVSQGYIPNFPYDVLYVSRGREFERTLTFTDKNTRNPNYTTVVEIVSVNVIGLTDRDNIEIQITGPDSINISGVFWSGWSDEYHYFPLTENSSTTEFLTATDHGNCPPNQKFFNLDQDVTDYVTKSYNTSINVIPTTYDQKNTTFDNDIRVIGDLYNTEISATQRVINRYDDITNFVEEYYASSN